ncbi:WYL domain-containing protein [Sulfuricurvum sp.]|uniref:helix-turn-helix transcriptional regulator n=1 Tax=Sulfuricurvum sp. TaxID=2025608 RepID=UPI0026076158|nr:WYL domain-containing protein [Sulfuricurvum sp.]MDD2267685.1 WYL domain-containing protein [Sulfuricurvum sp.]MDD2784122.1 WYL domain-containing protein [Sulfuricurvum sp.]
MGQIHDYDKILTRLTIILQRLYEGELLSVQDLALEFNVSTKTIQRDFNQRLIRFPIEKQGMKWKMQSGHAITKERSPEEALVLEMLGNIAEGIGSEFGVKAKSLFSKLQNNTKNPIYSKTIIEDISDKLSLFHIIEEAIMESKMVIFNYNGKLRHVHPYKIVSFEGYWYLYGEELLENKLKTYYFKGIDHLQLTNETFIPNDKTYKILERAINAWFEPDKEPFAVTIRATAEIAKYFHRRPLASTQRIIETYKDGSMEIEVLVTAEREILHEIKKWMPDLIITSPKALALKAKAIADSFLSRQIEHLIQ